MVFRETSRGSKLTAPHTSFEGSGSSDMCLSAESWGTSCLLQNFPLVFAKGPSPAQWNLCFQGPKMTVFSLHPTMHRYSQPLLFCACKNCRGITANTAAFQGQWWDLERPVLLPQWVWTWESEQGQGQGWES